MTFGGRIVEQHGRIIDDGLDRSLLQGIEGLADLLELDHRYLVLLAHCSEVEPVSVPTACREVVWTLDGALQLLHREGRGQFRLPVGEEEKADEDRGNRHEAAEPGARIVVLLAGRC